MLKAEWENLAETYVRLAEQSDDEWDTDDLTYDPIQDMLDRNAALTDSTPSIRSQRVRTASLQPTARDEVPSACGHI
jgi:hypothetical protein